MRYYLSSYILQRAILNKEVYTNFVIDLNFYIFYYAFGNLYNVPLKNYEVQALPRDD